MPDAALELRGVTRVYDRGHRALTAVAGVDLTVRAQEFVALLGPSGCGKSTLLNVIAGLDRPSRGEVLVAGAPMPAAARLRHFAYQPQRDALLPWRSVLRNVTLGLEVSGIDRREAEARARPRLAEFGLSGFAEHWPRQLSGGMRQRAALLRTFLLGRPFLLLDEPFGALDAITRQQMQGVLLEAWANAPAGALLVTHDVREAVYLADRVYVLSPRPGRIEDEVPVRLPRPRPPDVVHTPEFQQAERRLVRTLARSAETSHVDAAP